MNQFFAGSLLDIHWFYLKICSLQLQSSFTFDADSQFTLKNLQAQVLEEGSETFRLEEDDDKVWKTRYAYVLFLCGAYDRALSELASCGLLVHAALMATVLRKSDALSKMTGFCFDSDAALV